MDRRPLPLEEEKGSLRLDQSSTPVKVGEECNLSFVN